jgi:Fe-S cluster assembly ATP-binding protein
VSELRIRGLRASAGGSEILRGVDLTVGSGEVHAVMGRNGSGKSTLSHVLAGKPGYDVTAGSATLDGVDLLAMAPFERACAGLFLAMQYPVEVPGVSLEDVLTESAAAGGRDAAEVAASLRAEAATVGLDLALLERSLNVDLSGGERKRTETVQLGVLRPKIAILDEIDSGLDVDGLRTVSRRIEAATTEFGLGVLVITHYARLLEVLEPDRVHILVRGEVVASGGPELAARVEADGYAAFAPDDEPAVDAVSGAAADPFADPFGF